jgi:ribosome-associated protein
LPAPSDADKTLNLILSRLDDMKAEETVTKALKETGIKNIHVEGLPNCDWVLIDSGDVIVHVFRPEVREFYNLERLWSQGPGAAKAI